MKKLIFTSVIFSAILFSCAKDEPIPPDIDLSKWATTGNIIFTTPLPNDTIPKDSI